MKKEFISILKALIEKKEESSVKIDNVRPELLDGEQRYIVTWSYASFDKDIKHTTELSLNEIIYFII